MKVYRRKNKNGITSKKYSYDFYLKGKRYRGSTHLENKTEAIEEAWKIHKAIKDKVIHNIKNPTFKELFLIFKENKENYLKSLSKSTKSQFKLTVSLALPFFEKKDFNKENINLFILNIQKSRNISDRTLLKYINPLKVICEFCNTQGELSKNPFENLDLSELQKSKNVDRVRFLSKEEYKELFEVLEDDIIKDYIEFSLNTGLRQGEQLDLTWDRVYFEEKNIYINETKTDTPRTVPLAPKALQILQKRYNKKLQKPFPFKKGKLNYYWYKALEETKIKDFHFHDLRHTFASWAIKGWHSWQQKPMELYRLSKWLGHKDIKMTLKYAHLCVDDLKQEINEQ